MIYVPTRRGGDNVAGDGCPSLPGPGTIVPGVISQSPLGYRGHGYYNPVIFYVHHRFNINTVAITHGRNDSTLRDHPAFFRNITQAHTRRRKPCS
jgi:hypothetical protein